MDKRCECGDTKRLHLRTVIFARIVNITRVPVYGCSQCGTHELYSGVRQEVVRLIGKLGSRPAPRTIPFDQVNEWAGVLSVVLAMGRETFLASDVARAAEQRTNELLDLWLIASSAGDEIWKAELQDRLSQLGAQYIT